jgi:hypothetical protein
MLDNFFLNQIKVAFVVHLGEKPNYVHPFLSNFVKVTWLWHKSAMMSMMLLIEVKSHEKGHGSKKI